MNRLEESAILSRMIARPTDDPLLARFRRAVEEAYGERVERVILYGSRARGDAGPRSDYDLAVFLKGLSDRAEAIERLADLGTDLLYETGRVVHALPFPAEALDDRSPLLHEIRTDGITL